MHWRRKWQPTPPAPPESDFQHQFNHKHQSTTLSGIGKGIKYIEYQYYLKGIKSLGFIITPKTLLDLGLFFIIADVTRAEQASSEWRGGGRVGGWRCPQTLELRGHRGYRAAEMSQGWEGAIQGAEAIRYFSRQSLFQLVLLPAQHFS